MLLTKLDVQSFRGLCGFSFTGLAPVSVIVGNNNSGKSSVLEAVALLMRPLDPAQWIQVARQRDADAELTDALWSLFRSRGVIQLDGGPQQSQATHLSGVIEDAVRTLDVRAIATEDWDADEEGAVTLRIGVKVDDQDRHDLVFRRAGQAEWGEGVTHYKSFTVTPLTHRSGRTLVEHLSRVVDEGQKSLALDLLKRFDDRVEAIDVSAGRRRQTIVVKHSSRGVVDLASFGDGMRRVVALALALSRADGGVLLVDELESGIHPELLTDVTRRLVEAAATAGVQVIATTHSLEAVDALISATEGREEWLAGYHLFAEGRGHHLRRYGQEKLARLRCAGLDLR